jgi:hypothetical protein
MQVDEEVETSLLVACTSVDTEPMLTSPTEVHLDGNKFFMQLGDKKGHGFMHWILDSGSTIHMMGEREAFSELDTKIHRAIHFGDGSVTRIEGRGMIFLRCMNSDHKTLADVYLIPHLTMNIVSLGKLE